MDSEASVGGPTDLVNLSLNIVTILCRNSSFFGRKKNLRIGNKN